MDVEKMRTVRQGGKTAGKVRVRELKEGGKVRGYQIDYRDGRVEGVVRPDPIRYQLSVKDDQ